MNPALFIKEDLAGERSLIDELLDEQKRLTAVERFAQKHERHQLPLQQPYYRELIPLSLPKPGEQFAFQVDLDACSGCKACVTACHNLNGLDDNETWRETGVLLGASPRGAVQQTVTTACHHCVEPGCLEGCPVMAYEKDPVTGIVRHLDDQCIGCQYCVLKCPYEVPQYSASRGIVRKCDMCHGRLAAGEAPACVQACPNGAITIRIVDQRECVAEAATNRWLPDSPAPGITIPTTRYVGAQSGAHTLKAMDHYELRAAQAHPPLVFMLVLTQLSVGALLADLGLRATGHTIGGAGALVAAGACLAGLFASVFHLGRPLQAWKSFLGWRTSWLSREVIVFGGYAPGVMLYALLAGRSPVATWAGASAALCGLAGIACSAMLYADTRREFWRLDRSAVRFFGTAAVLGGAFAFAFVKHQPALTGMTHLAAGLLIFASVAKLWAELALFAHLRDPSLTPLKRTALLTLGELGPFCRARFAFGILGGIILPLVSILLGVNREVALVAFALCLVAEFCERHLFFTTVASPRMPGAL